jgi:hypothetical protein
MSIVVSALQIYVLAGPLGQHVVLPEPWNYVTLALAFYSLVVLFEIFTGGIGSNSAPEGAAPDLASSEPRLRRISYVAGILAAVSSSLAVGLPLYMLPAPVIGAISAVSFFWKPRISVRTCSKSFQIYEYLICTQKFRRESADDRFSVFLTLL